MGLVVVLVGLISSQLPIQALNLAKQELIVQDVTLGTADEQLIFEPNQLTFQNGKLYTMVLHNPSSQKHYFTAKDFTDAIWTRKAEFAGVEIKGQIRDIELKPDASVEWSFVPVKAGTYPLQCTIKGHAAAGMIGEITITD